MALTPTFVLTVDLAAISGLDVANVAVNVQLVTPQLVYPLGMPTETLFPTQLHGVSDASGIVMFNLLPSTEVGNYRVGIGSYSRDITMPDRDVRLSELGPAVDPGITITEYLLTNMSNLLSTLTATERSAVRQKLGIASSPQDLSALEARVTRLEGFHRDPPPITQPTFYIGWASPAQPGNVRPEITAADFGAATSYEGDEAVVPVIGTPGDYLWFARDVYPSHVRFTSVMGRDSIRDFTEQVAAVDFGGDPYRIGVSNNRSSGRIGGRDVFFEE